MEELSVANEDHNAGGWPHMLFQFNEDLLKDWLQNVFCVELSSPDR